MKRYTTFEEDEENGTVIARSTNQTDAAVRFEYGFAEWDDESSGNWEGLLRHLLEDMLGNDLDIDEEGNAVIDVDRAAKALAETEYAREEQAARAMIEYLDHRDIVSIEGSAVTVLRPPHTYEEGEMDQAVKMYSNWAAAFDTLVDRIDTAVDRVQEAQDRLESRETDTADISEHLNELREKREEYKQEMLSVVGDRDVDELDETEHRRFEHAREQYYHYDNLLEQERGGETIPSPNPAQMDLGEIIDQLTSTRRQFELEKSRLRDNIRTQQLWPTEAVNASEQFTNVLSVMGNVVPKKERMEEESGQSLIDSLRESKEDVAELSTTSKELNREDTITNER